MSFSCASVYSWLNLFRALLFVVLLSDLAGADEPVSKTYALELMRVPPSKVWCRFDDTAGKVVVFDPADPDLTTRVVVTLSGASKSQCYATPGPREITVGGVAAAVDLAWKFEEATCDLQSSGCEVEATTYRIDYSRPEKEEARLVVNDKQGVVIRITPDDLPDMKGLALTLRASEGRGVDPRFLGEDVSAVINDTLEILAQIALERAKSKGARFIQDQLEELICQDLRFKVEPQTGTIRQCTSLECETLLPNVCNFVRDVPLVEMVESAPKLARALEHDVVNLGFRLVIERLTHQLDVKEQRLAKIVLSRVKVALDQLLADRVFSNQMAQALVLNIVSDLADQSELPAAVCPVQVALAVAAACQHQAGGCRPDDIVAMLRSPAQHFSKVIQCGAEAGLESMHSPFDQTQFIVQLLDVLEPRPEAVSRGQLRAATLLAFDIIERLAVAKQGPNSGRVVVEHAEAIALALFDQEIRVALTHGIALARLTVTRCDDGGQTCDGASKLLQGIEKFSPIMVAITSNAANLRDQVNTPEQKEAMRESRKKTLEAVIDAATQRERRGGEWVVSLGANVGGLYGYRFDEGESDGTGNLTLPMGVAVQLLPKDWWGLHFLASFVDLAQFVDTTNEGSDAVQWNDFALVGAQVGFVVGTAENMFSIGPDVRYSPGGRFAESWFIGGTLAYYVPFFDVN